MSKAYKDPNLEFSLEVPININVDLWLFLFLKESKLLSVSGEVLLFIVNHPGI